MSDKIGDFNVKLYSEQGLGLKIIFSIARGSRRGVVIYMFHKISLFSTWVQIFLSSLLYSISFKCFLKCKLPWDLDS